jgi:hypothetical protein
MIDKRRRETNVYKYKRSISSTITQTPVSYSQDRFRGYPLELRRASCQYHVP